MFSSRSQVPCLLINTHFMCPLKHSNESYNTHTPTQMPSPLSLAPRGAAGGGGGGRGGSEGGAKGGGEGGVTPDRRKKTEAKNRPANIQVKIPSQAEASIGSAVELSLPARSRKHSRDPRRCIAWG